MLHRLAIAALLLSPMTIQAQEVSLRPSRSSRTGCPTA